ncbi:hypothetical protein [Gallaecimonas xiamenensis]|uniref:Uncharacterized protein n=1 Tax=Gallaecimonas xiamenensis 3-C-1 TaxID=745411 RepID=K2K2G1_9GAMM|nr:hypothetical protein [Gallaecimonas xiamenensis]EKE77059.1 hypothetical protein B3C1_02600 [Gallaecimonas xiamenensis 3-C-1]
MPKFRMPDGTFIEAASYSEARRQQQAARPGPGPVPVAVAAPPPVTARVELTPQDNFNHRSTIRFGVGEQIDINVVTVPPGQLAALGAVQWRVTGPAALANPAAIANTLICGDRPGAVMLELRTMGAVPRVLCSKRLEVVAPSDATMQQRPGTNTFHINGTASAGFKGNIFLQPVDVSFRWLQFREGGAPYEGTGSLALQEADLADIAGGQVRHPVLGTWLNVLGGNAATGSKVEGVDTVRSTALNPPFAAGTFTWAIPWFYRVQGHHGAHRFTTATHHEVVTNAGQMTISKKGVVVAHAAADPTSNF